MEGELPNARFGKNTAHAVGLPPSAPAIGWSSC